jgi:flagella basal body P-ring formation protein FlgA
MITKNSKFSHVFDKIFKKYLLPNNYLHNNQNCEYFFRKQKKLIVTYFRDIDNFDIYLKVKISYVLFKNLHYYGGKFVLHW